MTPIELTLSGFKAFSKPQTFRFPEGRGLFQLTGENQVDEQLGANAVGKSTLWDAVCWCLFGKTLRGQKGPSILNWESGKDGASVELTTTLLGREMRIKRMQHPVRGNQILLSENEIKRVNAYRPVEQSAIDQLLGFGYDEFCNTIVLGQFSRFFFDLTPTEKLKVFSDALKLDVWEDARKQASTKRHGVAEDLQAVNLKLERLRGKREVLKDQVDPELIAKEIKSLGDLCNKQTEVAEQKEKESQTHRLAVNEHAAAKEVFQTQVSELQTKKVLREATHKKITQENITAQSEANAARTVVTSLETQIKKVQEKEGGECPVCYSQMDKEHVANAVKLLRKRMAKAQTDADEKMSAETKVLARFQDSRAKLEAMGEDLEMTRVNLSKIERLRSESESKRQLAEQASATASRESGRLAIQCKELEGTAQKVAEELEEVREGIAFNKLSNEKLTAELVTLDFWMQTFPKVRLFVIDSAIVELKTLTNSYAEQLGLIGWEIDFSIEREAKTKSANPISRFDVLIRSPESGKTFIPWESFSGAESQILRIAGACAVSSLIRDRMGIDSPVECWDEVIKGMSQPVIERAVEFFRARSRKLKRSVYLIDHVAPHGRFDKRFCVVKDKNGSRIKELA